MRPPPFAGLRTSFSGRALLRVLLAAGVIAAAQAAAAGSAPPAPTRWVTDAASLLTEGTRATLDTRLEAYQRATGHQVLVWIAASSGEVPVELFAVDAFKAWRVGRQGLDDGLVLFIFERDHRMRLEVGYGLEGVVTDAQSARILTDVLAPKLRAQDADGAVVSAVDALLGLMGGEVAGAGIQRASGSEAPRRSLSLAQWVLLGLFGLGFLVLLITHPQMALFLLASIVSNAFGRRGGSGGAGWTGGGGRTGGGGATGSW